MIGKLPAAVSGTIRHYKGNGRKLGYPTANIDARTTLRDGIYFGLASLSAYQHHPALVFIGVPITVGDTTRRIEAHLLDIADLDYYGQNLTLKILHFHRPNQKFDSVDALVAAIQEDEAAGRAWFKEHKSLAIAP